MSNIRLHGKTSTLRWGSLRFAYTVYGVPVFSIHYIRTFQATL